MKEKNGESNENKKPLFGENSVIMGKPVIDEDSVYIVEDKDNPFHITPEMQQLIAECRDTNLDEIQNKLLELLVQRHNTDYIQFMSDKGTLMQISLEDWARHMVTKLGHVEPWYMPAGSLPVDPGLDVHAELRINGKVYNQSLEDILQSTDQQRLRERIRRDVIADLRRRWGGNTTEALDDQGYVVTLTAEQVADQAMEQHLDRGLQELDQPFSRQPKGRDVETIYGSRARDMTGRVRVNDVSMAANKGVVILDEISEGKVYDIQYETNASAEPLGLSRAWRPESILAKRSKTVHKPVRKVKLRDKARAQRRARKKSR